MTQERKVIRAKMDRAAHEPNLRSHARDSDQYRPRCVSFYPIAADIPKPTFPASPSPEFVQASQIPSHPAERPG
jgi:hypothetical protein